MNRQQIFLYTFLGSPKGPILVEKRFNFRFVQGALLGCIFRFVSYHFYMIFEPFPIRIKPLLSRLMAVLYSFQVVLFQYLFLNLFRFAQGAFFVLFQLVFSMVFTRCKIPAISLMISLDAISKIIIFCFVSVGFQYGFSIIF